MATMATQEKYFARARKSISEKRLDNASSMIAYEYYLKGVEDGLEMAKAVVTGPKLCGKIELKKPLWD